MTQTVRQLINEGEMSSYQMFVIGICVTINMLDGFDVLVVAFTASSIAADWSIPNSSLGIILSAGLIGMAAGSLFLAPFADRVGRRTMILLGLVIITIGMLASAFSQSMWQMVIARLFTGLGIGGLLASMNVLVAEYSSRKYRSLAISFLQSGYPIGATIGGSIVVILISEFGWRAAFLFGATLSGLMIPLVFTWLPESLYFMMAKRPRDVLRRVNAILGKIGQPAIERLPDPESDNTHEAKGIGLLFSGEQLRRTLLIWTSFFMLMFSFYFVLSWTPKLLVTAGLSTEQGISGSVLLNLGGVVGGLMLGVIAAHIDLKRLVGVYMLTTSVLMVVFGLFSGQLVQALSVAIFLGFFLFGSMIGLYAITPTLYDTGVRATGMGWAIGVGRIGAIIAPFAAGLLLDDGMSTTVMFIIFAVPMVFAALAQGLIKR